jgi:hypothetical protein
MFQLFKRANKEEISSTLIGQSQHLSLHSTPSNTLRLWTRMRKKIRTLKLAMVDIGKD